MDNYEQTLLAGWEEVHNKAQASLWILLALKDAPRHMEQIKQFMAEMTNGQLTPDDKSVYRALRRFKDSDIVDFCMVPSQSGPDKKVYELTSIGKKVLAAFVERNIVGILYQDQVRKLIAKKG